MSSNSCLVLMAPDRGTTTIAPSFTAHLAGLPSLSLTQFDKSLPSKRTMASEGACVASPGSMTFGSVFGSGIWKAALEHHAATAKRTIARLANSANRGDEGRVIDFSLENPGYAPLPACGHSLSRTYDQCPR